MKILVKILIILTLFIHLTSCNENVKQEETETIGKYQKESLPADFSYNIRKDLSNTNVDKNELYIEINKKITIGQLATLADKLFKTKDKRRRFYLFYYIKGSDNSTAWAISHFDPDLKIEIIGTTESEETQLKKSDPKIDGKIIGHWYEEKYTSASFILFEKKKKLFMKMTFKDGSSSTDEMTRKKSKGGYRLIEKEGNAHGEYYIYYDNGNLDFYNSEDKKFTTGLRVQ